MRYMSTAFSCHATETPGRKGHSLMAPDGNRGSFQVAPVTRQSSWYLDIFGIPPTSPNIPQHAMFVHDLTCSYDKMMPKNYLVCSDQVWNVDTYASSRQQYLPTMSSPSPRPVKQIAGWNPCDSWGFTTFWGVHLGDEWQFHDIQNDVYVCAGSA